MGLDIIEVLMSVEDEFELAIPDEDAERVFTTVGATVDYLVGRLAADGRRAGVCPSSRTFYRLRRDVVARFGVDRRAVRMGSTFGRLIPAGKRSHWKQVARASGIPSEPRRLSDLFSDRFPGPGDTVRQLLSRVAPRPFVRSDRSVDADAVFLAVRRIVADVTGVDETSIHRSSHYGKDLG